MADSANKKKVAVAGLTFILLVAGVAASSSNTHVDTSTSSEVVQSFCSNTDFKDTCLKSLAHAESTSPKELIKTAFEATIQNIGHVLKHSITLREAAADKSTKDAYKVCQEVLVTAVSDLRRSFDKVGEFDIFKADEYVEDLKVWLSAVITNQETCIDAFENTTGDNGEKMRNMLRIARELSSNGLAFVSDFKSLFGSFDFGFAGSKRHLLSDKVKAEEHFVNKRFLAAAGKEPNAVVALDGSGQFKSINDAIATIPKKNSAPFVIYVKAGVYKEYVSLPKGADHVTLVGDGPLKTIVTGDKSFAKGVKTFDTCTVGINADDFMAKDIAFENTAGPIGHQAVALRVSGDRAIFFNVAINGYQDTLYAQTYRQYYRDCSISGTIDFIFGDSVAIFQNCKFIVRKPGPNQGCMVTAQGRLQENCMGVIVIQNGNITAEADFLAAKPMPKAYLGRPWKEFSRTIIMQSNIEGFIAPEGWSPWTGTFALDTCYYGEYQNRGPGSDTSKRVTWKGIKQITPEIAESFTGEKAYGGDLWVKNSGVPYVPTMMQV